MHYISAWAGASRMGSDMSRDEAVTRVLLAAQGVDIRHASEDQRSPEKARTRHGSRGMGKLVGLFRKRSSPSNLTR